MDIERQKRLCPEMTPRYVRCYDNGGETFDRFTVVFTGRYRHKTGGAQWYVGMSANPYVGFGQHGESMDSIDTNQSGFAPAIGRKNHLGTRIAYDALPDDCKALVLSTYCDLWDLSGSC